MTTAFYLSPVFVFRGVIKTYNLNNNLWQLGPLSFEVQQGEAISIIGPSGSGKSTLLHLTGALDTPDSGQILFHGKDISTLSTKKIQEYRNKHIGFVFQSFYLLPEFSLLENVAMPLKIAKVDSTIWKRKAHEVLEQVGLADRAKHLPKELSGGQRQRAAIARAIIHDPQLLLADEPTGNLDAKTGAEILQLLQTLQKQKNMTFMIVTHDEGISDMTERTIALEDGKIVGSAE